MNERIKSLLVECGAELVKGTHNGQTGTAVNLPVGQMFDFEKLAELIIKETMQVVANQLPSNQYLDVAHAVIEHFGVEK